LELRGLDSETLPRDVPLGGGVNPGTTFWGSTPLKFKKAKKTSKIRRDVEELSTLTATFSGTD